MSDEKPKSAWEVERDMRTRAQDVVAMATVEAVKGGRLEEAGRLAGLVEKIMSLCPQSPSGSVTVKIEDVPTTMTFGPNGVVWSRADGGKTIAAELRRLADECATMFDERPGTMVGMGKGLAATAIAEHLRKRADELDPQGAEK